jgi:preprotein translocase subunit SecY
MKQFIDNLRNIFRIEELRQRILYTLALLAVFRLGSFVILPGMNSAALSAAASQGGGGILDFINLFVGGAFARGSLFALGIMPYISASIIVQLLGAAVPSIQKMQREGESGQKKVNQITRYLTVLITFGQSVAYLVNMRATSAGSFPVESIFGWAVALAVLTAGTLFLVWLGERITENGIGNGTSLIIAIGIISELPGAFINEFRANPPMLFFVEVIGLGLATMAVVAMTQATRKIPINYARRVMGNSRVAGGQAGTARQYIPLKVNSAGVMPIIFAQSIMFIPATVASFFPESSFWTSTGSIFADNLGVGYNLIFGTLIVVFTYFYTAIVINPNDIADNLKRNSGFIPGVKPGKKTAEYIDNILSRITLPGSMGLAVVAILPSIASAMGVSQGFAQFFGGTGLLIMIGVVLDTLQQIESYLLMRRYDGLMKQGRVRKSAGGVSA